VLWVQVWTIWMSSLASKCKIKRLINNNIMARGNHESLRRTRTKGWIPRIAKMVGRILEVIPLETIKTSQ
jgi:hypothetical protein